MTSILSFALYAFGTGTLASMTMIPASDAVRVTVLVAVSAGIGRIIGAWATLPHNRWKRKVVLNVPQKYRTEVEEKVKHIIRDSGKASL